MTLDHVVASSTDTDDDADSGESRPAIDRLRAGILDPWNLARLLSFLAVTLFLAFGNPLTIGDRIPGDPGDAFLILALLIWGGDRSVHLFSGYWDGPMYAGGNDVMTYTDTFLPLAPPFKLLEVVTSSPVVAFNLLYILSWVLTCEFTYRLCLRVTTSRAAAYVGSIAFTFSTIRLGQTNHFQLLWAAFIPLAILAMLRFRERPTMLRGAALALVLVAQFLTSAYYGVVVFVVAGLYVGVLVVLWLVRRRPRSEFAPGVAAFGVSLAVMVVPFLRWYSEASDTRTQREGYPGYFALALGDLRSPSPRSRFMRNLGILDTDTVVRSSENYAYLGVFVLLLVPCFVVWFVARRRDFRIDVERRWVLVTTIAMGVFAVLFAFGRGPILGLHMPFYDAIVAVLPVFESVTGLVREFVFMQLALVLVATVMFARLLRFLPSRWTRIGVAGIVTIVVIVESMTTIVSTDVPTVDDGSLYDVMRELDAGVAVELPIAPADSPGRPFLAATRMLLGSDDDLQIVNGYSGYAPIDYEESVARLNGFPDETSLAELERLDVRYVVLHAGPIDTGLDGISAVVNDAGYAFYPPAEFEQILGRLPADTVSDTVEATDGVVLVLDR